MFNAMAPQNLLLQSTASVPNPYLSQLLTGLGSGAWRPLNEPTVWPTPAKTDEPQAANFWPFGSCDVEYPPIPEPKKHAGIFPAQAMRSDAF